MPKQKTKKSLLKRVKITSTGKILRRHQLGGGHLKRKKSKSALIRQKKMYGVAKAENKKYRAMLGL